MLTFSYLSSQSEVTNKPFSIFLWTGWELLTSLNLPVLACPSSSLEIFQLEHGNIPIGANYEALSELDDPFLCSYPHTSYCMFLCINIYIYLPTSSVSLFLLFPPFLLISIMKKIAKDGAKDSWVNLSLQLDLRVRVAFGFPTLQDATTFTNICGAVPMWTLFITTYSHLGYAFFSLQKPRLVTNKSSSIPRLWTTLMSGMSLAQDFPTLNKWNLT